MLISRTSLRRLTQVVCCALFSYMLMVGLCSTASWGAGPPAGSQIPDSAVPADIASQGLPFYNGETISVKVPANSTLAPGYKVNILECSDPGGSTARLPKSINNCDGDTIQGDTVLIGTDGSVNYEKYTIYQLPSVSALGENPHGQPVCNATHACVLYVGQNQEDFTAPHFFSQSFYVNADKADAEANDPGGSNTALLLAIILPIVAVVAGVALYLRRRRPA